MTATSSIHYQNSVPIVTSSSEARRLLLLGALSQISITQQRSTTTNSVNAGSLPVVACSARGRTSEELCVPLRTQSGFSVKSARRARSVTRVYLRSERVTNAALGVIRGCFDGIWLGLLSRRQLARIDEAYYDRNGQYAAESYNRQGLWHWEQSAIENHFSGVRSIVVTSAGGGREVLALAKAGYEVAGFEPHQELARFGSRLLVAEGLDASIDPSPRDRWPAGAIGADGAVVGWGGYMLISGRAHRIAFLHEAAEQLPAGAPILLSFFVRTGAALRFRTAAGIANPMRQLLHRPPVDMGDALMPNLVHFFTRTEVATELADAGFDLVDFGSVDYGWAVGVKASAAPARNERRTDAR
jgi:hypothetical protein